MFDWENMRHFLALARIGTFSGAARSLKVDHATVSRRLSALEDEMKTRLVERFPDPASSLRLASGCSNWRREWKRMPTRSSASWMSAFPH